MQAKRVKIIKVPLKGRKKLLEKYGCSTTTLYNALGNRTHSEFADTIRQDALSNFGGVRDEKIVFN